MTIHGCAATGETVIFFREDCFYPVTLSGTKPTAEEIVDHANLNPGTIRIESMSGKVLWERGSVH